MNRRLLFASALAALMVAACGKKAPPKNALDAKNEEAAGSGGEKTGKRGDEFVQTLDLNRDDKPDVWAYYVKTPDGQDKCDNVPCRLVRKEKDYNGDGKIDEWEYYADDGRTLDHQAFDMDFDGKVDVTLYWQGGQVVRREYDMNFDGKIDVWAYYEKNKLVRKERDTNGDGKVDVWEYWENGELDRVGVDTDGDGQVDKWEKRGSAGGP